MQERNVGSVFEALDSSHNGVITQDDLDNLARGIGSRIGVAGDQESRLIDAYHEFWNTLQAELDTNDNESITRDEFVEGFVRPDVQEKVGEHSRTVARIIAELLDTDGDGQVSQSEYVRLVTGFEGMDDTTAAQGFQQIDTNGSGSISVAELEAAWLQMMTSADRSDPGAALLGNN